MTELCIIVAFAKEEVSLKMKTMLESGGIRVSSVCRSTAEIIRAAASTDRALIIMAQRLADGDADDVYDAVRGCMLIVAAKPEKRAMIENDGIIFMSLPTNRSRILSTVRMAIEPPRRKRGDRRPQRSEEDRKIIEKTKLYLMETHMMTEEQAHRFIQKRSMDMGLKFEETARIILGNIE